MAIQKTKSRPEVKSKRARRPVVVSGIKTVRLQGKTPPETAETPDLPLRFPDENPNPVLCAGKGGRLFYANRASAPLLKQWGCKKGGTLPHEWKKRIDHALSSRQRIMVDEACEKRIYLMDVVPGKGAGYANVYGHDITDIKQTERTLRESEVRYRRLFEDAVLGIFQSSPDGRLHHIGGLIEDITERKREVVALQESERRLSLIYDTVGDVIFHLAVEADGSYRFISVNQAFCNVTGLSEEVVVGKLVNEVIPEPSLSMVLGKYRQAIEENAIIRWEETSDYPTGRLTGDVSIAPVVDNKGHCTHLVGSVHDITERRRVEEALQRSELRFRTLYENAKIGLYRTTPDGTILMANKVLVKMLGYPSFEKLAERNLGKDGYEPTYQRKGFLEKIEKDGEINDFESAWVRQDGSVFFVRESAQAIRDSHGTTLYYDGMVEGITERKLAEEALRESEERFRTLVNSMDDVIYTLDRDGRHTGIYGKWIEKFRLKPERFLGKSTRDIFGPEEAAVHESANARALDGENAVYEWSTTIRKERRYFQTSVSPLHDTRGAVCGIVGVGRDITERKNQEAQILASLKEKEILLREIHHRVKNNLQVISSLFNLQMERLADPLILSVFRESQDRILSMSMVHEALYQSESFSEIDFADYLESFVRRLLSSYCADPNQVELRINAESVTIGIDQAIPCGLIVHELVSNAFKHAFPAGRKKKGLLEVMFRRVGNDLRLTVRDNGAGLPESISFAKSESLGFRLVGILIEQLDGKMSVKRKPGAEFIVTFPAVITSK